MSAPFTENVVSNILKPYYYKNKFGKSININIF